jgi:hypothetical protein
MMIKSAGAITDDGLDIEPSTQVPFHTRTHMKGANIS